MSHINIKVPSMGALKMKEKEITDFTGGVNFCMFPTDLRTGQSPFMKNLIFSKNLLRTRFGQKNIDTASEIAGAFHSKCENLYFGREVMHIGTSLVTFDGEKSYVSLDTLPDCDSFMFEMNSKVYVFCKVRRIFILDRDFTATEYELPAIEYVRSATYGLSSITYAPKSDLLVHGDIIINYQYSANSSYYYVLPLVCDEDFPLAVFDGGTGTEISPEAYYLDTDGKTIRFHSKRQTGISVRYTPVKGSECRKFDKIFDCTHAICYGGYNKGGTRVFFSGNPEQQSYYYYSELLDPLTVKELSYDILGDGSQDIVKFAKQKGDLMAFCDRSVYRITYNFDEETGCSFTTAEISSKLGCDMPGSVQLIDNRLVFANSSTGVHIITSSDFTDELSVRSLSSNILGSGLETGFLARVKDCEGKCFSIDFDRKYFLFFGTHAFVWDYSQYGYSTSLEPFEAERRLSWYYFDSIRTYAPFELFGKLYGLHESDENTKFMVFSDEEIKDFDKAIECEFMTPEIELSTVQAKKILNEVFFSLLKEDSTVKVTVYVDGKETQSESFDIRKDETGERGALERLFLAVTPFEGYRFSFKISSTSGILGIYDILMRFNNDRIFYR